MADRFRGLSRRLFWRIGLTLGLLTVFRLLAHVPLPYVDRGVLEQFLNEQTALSLITLFTAGGFRQFSIVLLGVGPYITSAIIFQLLASVIPSLERLQKEEGEQGRLKLAQYSRIASVPISLVQGYGLLTLLRSQGLFPTLTTPELSALLIVIAAGSVLIMWLGELITEYGIGNGTSLLITLGIIAGFPQPAAQLFSLITAGETGLIGRSLILLLVVLLSLLVVVIVTEARRNLPVIYARKVRSLRFSYSEVRTELPLLLNVGGVLPIIFALSIVSVPPLIVSLIASSRLSLFREAASFLTTNFQPQSTLYAVVYFLLVIFFAFFYALVVVNPKQIAENLSRQGAYIAGVRPGEETVRLLRETLIRLTTFGSIFLALIAILPFLLQAVTGTSLFIVGGTGLLIVVSVIIETMRVIQSQVLQYQY